MIKVFKKSTIHFALRVIVSLSLIFWLLSGVDFAPIVERWQGANWWLIGFGIPIVHLVCMWLRAMRLRIILKRLGICFSFGSLCLIQWRGFFVTNFLPGQISGDIYRAYTLSKTSGQSLNATSGIMTEKVLGIGSLLALSMIGSMLISEQFPQHYFHGLQWVAFLALMGYGVGLYLLRQVLEQGFWNSFCEKYAQLGQLTHSLKNNFLILSEWTTLLKLFGLSMLIQGFIVVWYVIVAFGVGVSVPVIGFVMGIPLLELLVMLPISISGMGVRDLAFVVGFNLFSISAEDALSCSVLSLFLITTIKILSGFAFLIQPKNFERNLADGKAESVSL